MLAAVHTGKSRVRQIARWPKIEVGSRALAVAALVALLTFPASRAQAASQTGTLQRDSAARAADSARRVSQPNVSPPSVDTSRPTQSTARSAIADSARAESTAVAAERRRSLSIGNVGAIVALFVFGAAALACAALLLLAFSRGSSIEVETRWGGIGGGGGGWRLSSSFSYLLAALLFGGLFASTVWALLRVGEPAAARAAAPAAAPKDTTAKR